MRLTSRNFHTYFYWQYQVDLPDVCLKHLFSSNQAIQNTNLWWRICVLPINHFFFTTCFFTTQIVGVRLGRTIYTSMNTWGWASLLFCWLETEIVFLIVHWWKTQERAHRAVTVDIWYTATQPLWQWSFMKACCMFCNVSWQSLYCLSLVLDLKLVRN